MKIILSPDSFKGSLSARGVAEALEKGIRKIDPTAECLCVPIADGGEGTLETLVDEKEFQYATVRSTNGSPVRAAYGIKGKTAVIEMARAAGLTLVEPERRDPLIASTYGVGELILHALDSGCDHILLTVGGSGTNDGGSGMFCAIAAISHLDKRIVAPVVCVLEDTIIEEQGNGRFFAAVYQNRDSQAFCLDIAERYIR